MKKLVDYGEYIKELVKFPYGGKIGGEHKKKISDEDFEKNPSQKGITSDAYNVEREKNEERKISLMGDTLSGYNVSDNIQRLIKSVDSYLDDNRSNFYLSSIKDYLGTLSNNIIKHFEIDPTTKEGVEDFIENKFDLFKRSFEMWKEIDKRYPGERYGR